MRNGIIILVCIIIILIVYYAVQRVLRVTRKEEGWTNPSNLHMYWIVSEKRKPYMLQQIEKRGLKNVTFIPGIFDDAAKTDHPDLPKEWLGTPEARLLAAHMQAIRSFHKSVQHNPYKHRQMFVCFEDDVALHRDFSSMVEECAAFLADYTTPARILLGYVSPPSNVTKVKDLSKATLYKPAKAYGEPWGAQAYMLNYAYVEAILKHYEQTYKTRRPSDITVAADAFVFDIPSQYFLLDPPACIEDNPRFGTLMNHSQNTYYYKSMMKKYNRVDYFMFDSE